MKNRISNSDRQLFIFSRSTKIQEARTMDSRSAWPQTSGSGRRLHTANSRVYGLSNNLQTSSSLRLPVHRPARFFSAGVAASMTSCLAAERLQVGATGHSSQFQPFGQPDAVQLDLPGHVDVSHCVSRHRHCVFCSNRCQVVFALGDGRPAGSASRNTTEASLQPAVADRRTPLCGPQVTKVLSGSTHCTGTLSGVWRVHRPEN